MNEASTQTRATGGNASVSSERAAGAKVSAEQYKEMYAAPVADPETFWAEHGLRLDWIEPCSKVKNTSFAHDAVSIKWYEDGTLNVAANCIDRHLEARGDQTAIIWEPAYSEQTAPPVEDFYETRGVLGKADAMGPFGAVSKRLSACVEEALAQP